MTEKEKFERNLVKNICNIWLNWKIWKNLEDKKNIFWYKETEDITVLFSIQRAVWEKWILWLMKILDNTHNSDDKKTLSLKEYKNTYLWKEEKGKVKNIFLKNEDFINNINKIRNKYFCHSDKKYYLDWLESLFKENELRYEELENLLMQTIDLLRITSQKFNQNWVDTNEMDSCLNLIKSNFDSSWLIFENKIKKSS